MATLLSGLLLQEAGQDAIKQKNKQRLITRVKEANFGIVMQIILLGLLGSFVFLSGSNDKKKRRNSQVISVIVLPPCWIYNPFNMAEDGRKERAKGGDDFYLAAGEWQFHYLKVADAVCNPARRLFFPPSQWLLINTEGTSFWTISSEGSHWSQPEKSIMVFTNQKVHKDLWDVAGLHSHGAECEPSCCGLMKWLSSRAATVLMMSYRSGGTAHPCGLAVFKQHRVQRVVNVCFEWIWN